MRHVLRQVYGLACLHVRNITVQYHASGAWLLQENTMRWHGYTAAGTGAGCLICPLFYVMLSMAKWV